MALLNQASQSNPNPQTFSMIDYKNDIIKDIKAKASKVFLTMDQHETYKQISFENRLRQILRSHVKSVNESLTIEKVVKNKCNFYARFFKEISKFVDRTNKELEELREFSY